jgi:hypothetical protein
MTFTRIDYLISEMMGPPELLVVEGNGAARFESHTNIAEAGKAAVGTFATTLTPDQMKALETAVANPPFRDLPDHWGQIASGERYKLIRVVSPSGETEKRIGTARPVSSSTQVLIDRMDQVVKLVRSHPLQNLELRVGDATVDSAGALRATMSLSNPGTVAIVCTNPATMHTVPDARLLLRAWPDRDISTIHSTDILEASSVAAQAINPMAAGSAVLLEMPPRAAASFHITAALPIPRNVPYVVQLLYQNTATERSGRDDLMVFEVYSQTERIK